MSPPILVLDIDGVLNRWDFDVALFNTRWAKVLRGEAPVLVMLEFLRPELMVRLNALVAASGCQVVMSSNWRNLFRLDTAVFASAREGLGFGFPIIGFIPKSDRRRSDPLGSPRGEEVHAWMKSRGAFSLTAPPVVALDDDHTIKLLPEQHRVLCDPEEGLTVAKAGEALRKLFGVEADGRCWRCACASLSPECAQRRVHERAAIRMASLTV